jgi:hypothetical protein
LRCILFVGPKLKQRLIVTAAYHNASFLRIVPDGLRTGACLEFGAFYLAVQFGLFTSSSNLGFPNELVVIVPGLLLATRYRPALNRCRYLYLRGQGRHFHAQPIHSPITQQTGRFNNMRILVRCPHLFVVHMYQLGNTWAPTFSRRNPQSIISSNVRRTCILDLLAVSST